MFAIRFRTDSIIIVQKVCIVIIIFFLRGVKPVEDTEANTSELLSLKADLKELRAYEETLDNQMKVRYTFYSIVLKTSITNLLTVFIYS